MTGQINVQGAPAANNSTVDHNSHRHWMRGTAHAVGQPMYRIFTDALQFCRFP